VAEYSSVEEARKQSGMRVVCAPGIPGPWGEAIKGVLDIKKIPYTCVGFEIGSDHKALIEWSAQASAPVIAWNDEFPRSNWAEQLFLAERIEPNPRLIPKDLEDRARMFGLAGELCGMHGFGWSRRLIGFHAAFTTPGLPEEALAIPKALGPKYGYSREAAEAATPRVLAILAALRDQLEEQHSKGRKYFIGEQLSALDVYWAAFAALIEPMPAELCPMIEELRPAYQNFDPAVDAAARPLLMEHRDFIYREHLVLPIDL